MAIGGEAGCSKLAGDEQSTNSTKRLHHATIPDDSLSVCDGRTHLGWMVRRGERFEAIDPQRQSFGLFNTGEAAYHALLASMEAK